MLSGLFRGVYGLLVLGAASTGIAAAAQHVPLTDQQIASQIEHRLVESDIRGVTVTARDHTVTLSGAVRNLWMQEQAIEEARKVSDIRDVVSTVTVIRGENDRAIAETVAATVRRYALFTIFDDVQIEVTDGIVSLTGWVTVPYKAQALRTLAARMDGVQQVLGKIDTLPVSGFDDQIRYTAAVRIYNHRLFWTYGIQAEPPIHIVVRNSRVTLTGVVMSEVERGTAELLVGDIFGVLSVENTLRVER